MKRRRSKSFRRDVGTPHGYLAPIIYDAFIFEGTDIGKKRELDYMKAI